MARKPAAFRWSREKEARVQSRMLDVLERRFARRAAALVAAESYDLLDGYRSLGFVPPSDDRHYRAWRDLYFEIALISGRTFGRRVTTQGKAAGRQIEVKEGGFVEFFQALANAWINLEAIRQRIVSVPATTRRRIIAYVEAGDEAGLGVDTIARNIARDVPSISKARGALIARTETHGAANYAAFHTAKSTGLDLVKEWVAVEDHRTRRFSSDDQFDHAAMDGQVRQMDEPFEMPWLDNDPIKIMFPGEAGHPGGATINCRCAAVFDVPE